PASSPACTRPASRSTARCWPTWRWPSRRPSLRSSRSLAAPLPRSEGRLSTSPPGRVSSVRHPIVQRLRRLSGRRSARADERAFVLEGATLLGEALAAGVEVELVLAAGDDPAVDA